MMHGPMYDHPMWFSHWLWMLVLAIIVAIPACRKLYDAEELDGLFIPDSVKARCVRCSTS